MRNTYFVNVSVRFFMASVVAIGLLFFTACGLASPGENFADTPDYQAAIHVPGPLLPEGAPTDSGRISSFNGQVFTLAECIKIALERNPETQSSWQTIRSADARVGQAGAAYQPDADFTAGANRGDIVSLDSQKNTGPANTFDAGFGVRYLLFDGGGRSAGLESAEAALLNANFQHNATLQSVALVVEEAYYRLLAAKQTERVAKKTIEQSQYHVDVSLARHKNGLVAKSDVLKAETEKAEADLELIRARSLVRIERGRLANAMGLNASESFDVEELPQNPHQRELTDIKELMDEAASRRPELLAALSRIESERADVRATSARYRPKVTLNADYGLRDRTFAMEHAEWALGVGITLPLFDGLDRKYSIRQENSALAKTVAEHEKLLRSVELEVWIAYSRLLDAGQTIEAAGYLVASSEESARVAEAEYKNGTGSIIDMIDAQTTRTRANVRLVQARLDWHTAMARLERAVGRTLTQKIPADDEKKRSPIEEK